uniref:Homeobox domain-containing protein n=1 Tax=Meleagris gallopavo TaxID=9103 RepID=A0A803YQC5_MELGA
RDGWVGRILKDHRTTGWLGWKGPERSQNHGMVGLEGRGLGSPRPWSRSQAEGQQNLMEFVGGEPSKKRKRRTSFTPQAIEALNAYFEKNALPTGQEITEIAKELNYDREVVRVWFCNRRQTLKNTSKLNVFQIP